MKSLKTIQTLAKIAKVLSRIAFVGYIVALVVLVAGLICLAIDAEAIRLGERSLDHLLRDADSQSLGSAYAKIAAYLCLAAGHAVLARFAVHYFARELADGTPFTPDGARELSRLGILAVGLPIASRILVLSICGTLRYVMTDVAIPSMSGGTTVTLGVFFLVAAQLCRCGAELTKRPSA